MSKHFEDTISHSSFLQEVVFLSGFEVEISAGPLQPSANNLSFLLEPDKMATNSIKNQQEDLDKYIALLPRASQNPVLMWFRFTFLTWKTNSKSYN